MKIGILTYHFSINFGAVLQCYALLAALRDAGHDAVVINYVSDEQADNVSLYRKNRNLNSVVKNALLLPFHKLRKERNNLFREFSNNHLKCTRRVKDYNGFKSLLKDEAFDAIFVGSDQVWNPLIKDFDKIFFLKGVQGVRKVGYAVSIGEATFDDLYPYRNEIENFDIVSMREKSAAGIIKNFCSNKIHIALDPTFLLSNDQWKKMSVSSREVPKNKYLTCLFLNKEKYERNLASAKSYADRMGLNFVLLEMRVSKTSIKYHGIINIGPSEFLKYIQHSACVITDSFHTTVFPLLLNVPFYSINNNPESNDTRRIELLSRFSMESNYIPVNELEKRGLPQFDSNIVNKVLQEMRNSSFSLIGEMLS